MSNNTVNATFVNFYDPVTQSGKNLFQSGDALYFGEQIVNLGENNSNSNEIMLVRTNLQKNATTHKIYYPLGYAPANAPKVMYSVEGAYSNDIIPNQLSEITQDYYQIEFARPIPNENFYATALILKNNSYLAFSGTNYDLNNIRTAKSLYVDVEKGWDYGSLSGQRSNPNYSFRTLAQALTAAEDGDRIYFYPGIHSGAAINKNVELEFAPNAIVSYSNLNIQNGKTVGIHDLNLSGAYAVLVGENSVVNFFGDNRLLPNAYIGGGVGTRTCNIYGNIFANLIQGVTVLNHNQDNSYNAVVTKNTLPTGLVFKNNSRYYNTIASAITALNDGDSLFIESGTYNESLSLSKNIEMFFDERSYLTNQLAIYQSDVKIHNLNVQNAQVIIHNSTNDVSFYGLNMSGNGYLSLGDSSCNLFGDCIIQSSMQGSITGANGRVNIYGNLYHNKTCQGMVKPANDELDYHIIIDQSGGYGKNGSYVFSHISDALPYITGNQRVLIKTNITGEITLNNKPNLHITFDKGSKITKPLTIQGTGSPCYLQGFNFDSMNDIAITHAIDLQNNNSLYFKGENYIRIPTFWTNYFVTGTGVETGMMYISGGFSLEYADGDLTGDLEDYTGYYLDVTGDIIPTVEDESGIYTLPSHCITGNGSVMLNSTYYNRPVFSGVDNLLGISVGFVTGASLFEPNMILI